ncbi:hypothetical protein P8452_48716 [Trifolium repens]|nr:hypothetical protein P8452_48716 [Trifolium repens]
MVSDSSYSPLVSNTLSEFPCYSGGGEVIRLRFGGCGLGFCDSESLHSGSVLDQVVGTDSEILSSFGVALRCCGGADVWW